jgi:hypothetical protein
MNKKCIVRYIFCSFFDQIHSLKFYPSPRKIIHILLFLLDYYLHSTHSVMWLNYAIIIR